MGWVAFSNVKTTACLVHMCPRLSPNAEYAILDSRLHQCRLASHTRRRRDRREVVYNYLLQCISTSASVERRVGGSSMEESLVNLGSTYSFQINWISGQHLCDWNNIRLFFCVFLDGGWMWCFSSIFNHGASEPWSHPACWRSRFPPMWQKWILEETSARNTAECCIRYFCHCFVFDCSSRSVWVCVYATGGLFPPAASRKMHSGKLELSQQIWASYWCQQTS